ncbi:MAG: FtsW/RodA/SpoVE family cell cycle protein [Clostridia bacterium]|nr:FtsW/RodA/SpoVE family cell cycle protein [Clostridia bacterium]
MENGNGRNYRAARRPSGGRRPSGAGRTDAGRADARRSTGGRADGSQGRSSAPGRRTAGRAYSNERSYSNGRVRVNTGRVAKKRSLVEAKREQKALVLARKEKEWQGEVERVRGGVDKIMLCIVFLIISLGALMVYSASYPTGLSKFGDSFYYLKRHLIFIAIGGAGMLVTTLLPYKFYKKGGVFIAYGVALILLAAVLVIGTAEGEAKRWIYIGSFSIQPSEIMKVSMVMMLAWYIDKYQHKMKEDLEFKYKLLYNTVWPFLIIGAAAGLVLLEKHLSGTAILGILGLAVMLVGGCRVAYTLIPAIVGGGAAAGLFLLLNPYALKRITTFTSEEVDILGEGWQTTQGIYAIGSGGLFGVGFGDSRQKFGYVSMAHNDFIYTIWCEELGFIGAVLLVVLFGVFLWRGYVIAMRAPDTFSMLTVFGITTQVALQAFLNMMVVCDVIPNTGISLPFFSYGGSSLIMLMAEMGIILSVSRQYYRKKQFI